MPASPPAGPTRDRLHVVHRRASPAGTLQLDCQSNINSPPQPLNLLPPGPDAPLVLDRSDCSMHHEHSFDFHKPAGCHFPEVPAPPAPEHVCSCRTLPPRMPALCHAQVMIIASFADFEIHSYSYATCVQRNNSPQRALHFCCSLRCCSEVK